MGLKRKKGLRRSKNPLRPNRKRRKRLHEKQFGSHAEFIREHDCCVCGSKEHIHAHHTTSRGAGGTKEHLVPVCWRCHQGIHDRGQSNYRADFIPFRFGDQIEMKEAAKIFWEMNPENQKSNDS